MTAQRWRRYQDLISAPGEPLEVTARDGQSLAGHDHVLVRDGDTYLARCACGVPTPPTNLPGVLTQARRHLAEGQADPGHQARVAELAAQLRDGSYVMPEPQDWIKRFTQRPEVAGAILHDMATRYIAEEETIKRVGRRPLALDRARAWEAMPLSVRRALENDGVLVGK
jgi:hypothetical protein